MSKQMTKAQLRVAKTLWVVATTVGVAATTAIVAVLVLLLGVPALSVWSMWASCNVVFFIANLLFTWKITIEQVNKSAD